MTLSNQKPTEQGLENEFKSAISGESILNDLPEDCQAVLDHILFHKALISDESDGTKLNRYLELVNELKYGSHVSISDPYDKSIAITFELAISKHLDPWDIDLIKFSEEYLERVREHDELDLITAGRIIFMAWSILKLQSDEVLSNAENPEPEEDDLWEPSGDWFTDDIDYNYTNIIKNRPKAPLNEMVWRKGNRPVTLLELVGAFEEAKKEAEILKILNEKRKIQRERDRAFYRSSINDNMHKEDLEADINMVYEQICEFNGHPIPFSDICEKAPENKITILVSSLYLAHRRKINIWQPDFPYGKIYIENLRDKKDRAPPASGSPAEDITFRAMRARERALEQLKAKGQLDDKVKTKGKDGKDKTRKKIPLDKVVTSKKGIAS